MCLRVGHQQSQFWPILARFMYYYSLIWGPCAISMIDEPRGAFMYRSSTILGLSNSGLFHGVLLTILGSQSYFHGCRTQDELICWSSRLAVLADSGPFLGLLLYLEVWETFPRLTTPEVRLPVSHQHSRFLSILTHFMDYYSPF